mgnify:CR=1 FL=1
MKVLGIEGSPRKNGNTEKLVKAVLDGAAEQGADTQFYKLADLDFSACRGCITCREDGVCTINDDMQRLYKDIQAAEVLVIGSPVYMWQVSAHTKAFMDRLVPFIDWEFETRLNSKKRLVLAYTQGNPDADAFREYFNYQERLFKFLHFDVKQTLVAAGTRDKKDIESQPEVLEHARQCGRRVAREVIEV